MFSRAPRALASACLVGSLALYGCAGQTPSTGSTTPATTSTLTLSEVVQDAVLCAEGVCAVAPSLASITAIILAADNSTSTTSTAQFDEATATAAADVFCKAVTGKTVTTSIRLAGRLRTVKAIPHLRTPAPVAGKPGVYDYGTVTINGTTVTLEGSPAQ